MSKLIIGRFLEVDSFFHRVTPTIKLAIFLLISIVAIVFQSLASYILIAIFLIVGVSVSKIGFKNLILTIKPLMIIFLWTLVFQIIFSRNGDILINLYVLKIYSSAVYNSFFVFLRMFILIGAAGVLTLSTSPLELTHGLEDLFKPLKYLKIPVETFALVISIALRFIPQFFDEIERIKIAQISKGYDVEDLTFFKKINYYGILLIPLLLSSVNRSETLANAMGMRGYGSGEKKTRFRRYSMKKEDYILIIIFIFLFTICSLLN